MLTCKISVSRATLALILRVSYACVIGHKKVTLSRVTCGGR